jgi:hypothetical protein
VGNNLFTLTNVDGQTYAAASIASNVVGGVDGAIVNSVQANARSIVLDLRINSGVDVETAKREVLKVVKIKQRGTLSWTQNGKTLTITGVIESIEMPRWRNAVSMQLTMYCDQPFWEDADNIVQEISEAISLHYFTVDAGEMLYFPEGGIAFGEYDAARTKEFYNDGDVDVGLEIVITAFAEVTNPIIYDGNGNFFGIGYGYGDKQVKMSTGDNIIVKTHKGKKSVTLNGQNVLSKLRPRSTWLQLAAGYNVFSINSDDDSLINMTFTLTYKQRYV